MCFSCSASFSPSLLNDLPKLKKFMSGESAIKDIKYWAKNPNLVHVPSSKSLYFGRLRVVWIYVTTPFFWLTSLFFSLMAKILSYTPFTSLERRFTVYSKQMMRDFEILTYQDKYKQRLLAGVFNAPQSFTGDIFTTSNISLSSIKNETMKRVCFFGHDFKSFAKTGFKKFYKKLQHNVSKQEQKAILKLFKKKIRKVNVEDLLSWLKEKYPKAQKNHLDQAIHKLYHTIKEYESKKSQLFLTFYNEPGVCMGMCRWFNFLYLKVRNQFSDPEKALICVANRFKTGASRQAQFLQNLPFTKEDNLEKDLIGLKSSERKEHKLSLYELDKDEKGAKKKIKSLPPGVYRAGVYHHSLSYIKISENKGYLFNPNHGLIKLSSQDQAKDLLKHVTDNHYVKEHPESHIYFLKQTIAKQVQ